MKKATFLLYVLSLPAILGFSIRVTADSDHATTSDEGHTHMSGSSPGENPWNQGQEPEDWWGTIKRMHGHVGPWNVLGWRIGKAALRELNATWGRHELDVICHIPMKTPYSCLADGVVMATGNSIGRLDIRLSEVMSMELTRVSVRRKDGTGPVLSFKPNVTYMNKIKGRAVEELETLSHECVDMSEADLFEIERHPNPDAP
jgi:formylmethanofuran dehydrogenase subunit E